MWFSRLFAPAALVWLAAACQSVHCSVVSSNLRANLSESNLGWAGPTGNIGEIFEFEPTGAHTLNTPAIDSSGNLYISFSSVSVYGVNGDTGMILWQYSSAFWGSFGNPVITSYGVVMIGNQKGVLALYTSTGNVAWSYEDGATTLFPTTVLTFPTSGSASDLLTPSAFFTGRGSDTSGSLVCYDGQVGACDCCVLIGNCCSACSAQVTA